MNDLSPERRATLERRRDYVRKEMETANGEYYHELMYELGYLNQILNERSV